uniref:Uncharacterized protein n=1 Tax=Leersia perrieri TaxID=77586 RepID=A0A0D9X411_9ORYZ
MDPRSPGHRLGGRGEEEAGNGGERRRRRKQLTLQVPHESPLEGDAGDGTFLLIVTDRIIQSDQLIVLHAG